MAQSPPTVLSKTARPLCSQPTPSKLAPWKSQQTAVHHTYMYMWCSEQQTTQVQRWFREHHTANIWSLWNVMWQCGLNSRSSLYLDAIYTRCPRRNVPDFGIVFLMLKYTNITQNAYIQSWTVTEIMAREKCGLLAVPRTAPVQLTHYVYTKMRSQQS